MAAGLHTFGRSDYFGLYPTESVDLKKNLVPDQLGSAGLSNIPFPIEEEGASPLPLDAGELQWGSNRVRWFQIVKLQGSNNNGRRAFDEARRPLGRT